MAVVSRALVQRDELNQELNELFDLKKAKARNDKILDQQSSEALREIRHLILMFRDGIPNVTISVSENESLEWRTHSQQLVYIKDEHVQVVEGTSKETMVKLRPFLIQIVRKAKEFYRH
ncbi:MAG: hypothetical protein ACJ76H_12380 [Bacteriovoracaceae bacterium]